jgi:hypothetical protein
VTMSQRPTTKYASNPIHNTPIGVGITLKNESGDVLTPSPLSCAAS